MENNHWVKPPENTSTSKHAASNDIVVVNSCSRGTLHSNKSVPHKTAPHRHDGIYRIFSDIPAPINSGNPKDSEDVTTVCSIAKRREVASCDKNRTRRMRVRGWKTLRPNHIPTRFKRKGNLKSNKRNKLHWYRRPKRRIRLKSEMKLNEPRDLPVCSHSAASLCLSAKDGVGKVSASQTKALLFEDSASPEYSINCGKCGERAHISTKSSTMTAIVEILDEMATKLSALVTLSCKENTTVVDNVSEPRDDTEWPSDILTYIHTTSQKILADIKVIRESVTKVVAFGSRSRSGMDSETEATNVSAAFIPPDSQSVGNANDSTGPSTRVLADIKSLRKMLAQSLEAVPDEPLRSADNTKSNGTISQSDVEEPHGQEITANENLNEVADDSDVVNGSCSVHVDEENDDTFGILRIYQNSCLHGYIDEGSSEKSREGADFGYEFFRLSNLVFLN